jgi:hypothetical protein
VKLKLIPLVLALAITGLVRPLAAAEALDPALQAHVDAEIKAVQALAADPVIVNAVKAQNAAPPPEYASMTQATWKDLSKLDPFVRAFDKNPAGMFLKSKKSDVLIRTFVCDATGIKVAFSTKTLNWSHKGDPKFELPMSGKTWQGPVEVDKASGLEQIQVSVPVLDGDKPIGSLGACLSLSKLQ